MSDGIVAVPAAQDASQTSFGNDTYVVATAGAARAGDGGAAPYIIASMDDASFLNDHPTWGVEVTGTSPRMLATKTCLPQMFRRRSDTDDTASFQRFRDGMEALAERYGVIRYKLLLDGRYLVREPGAILRKGSSTRLAGLTIEGLTRGCGIDYDPTTPGALIFNDDAVLGLGLSRFSVRGIGLASQAPFWESTSSGGAQDLSCTELSLYGSWGDAMFLLNRCSTNNNSEFRWLHCTFSSFDGKPTTVLQSLGSDQHLNYWFSQCNTSGDVAWVDMQKGGHVSIRDCDSSSWNPTSARWLVSLGDGGQHAGGVCQAVIDALRVEHATPHAKLLHCRWPYGSVRITNCDLSSQGFTGVEVTDHILVETGNDSGPAVLIDNNVLVGRARVTGLENFRKIAPIKFDNNQMFSSAETPDQYLEVQAQFSGARPSVVFTSDNQFYAKPLPGEDVPPVVAAGCNIGVCASPSPTTGRVRLNGSRVERRKYFSKVSGYDGGSSPADQVMRNYLPLGSILRSVRLFLPPQTSTSGYEVGIDVSDADGTVLLNRTLTGVTFAGGIDVELPIGIHLTTDAKRRLTSRIVGNTAFEDMDITLSYEA
jgi:hypothetical protein